MKVMKTVFAMTCFLAAFLLTACGGKTEAVDQNPEYVAKIFDQSYVHTINVEISAEDWADLRENPTDKTKYKVDVVIDGEKIETVSFATKGNTSLSSVAADPDSDRYSFKINFGKYVDDQTYYGLDKLNLNNIYADATYMKDYISYEIFRAAGVDAPLTSYVDLYINGEEFGLYLALEEVGDAFLERNGKDGALYKPESDSLENVGNGMPGGEMPQPPNGEWPGMPGGERPELPDGEMPQMPDGEMPQPPNGEMPQMPAGEKPDGQWPGIPGGFGSSSAGASLAYTDDDISSYSDIFDNAETDVTEDDQKRVIEALRQLSEGNASEAVDAENIIRYFAAHNFVMNYDSYTGNMLHNYYLYEKDGILSMFPWDYNLAFGGFGMENRDATDLVNWGIDSPLSGVSEADRPMWSFIANDESYLKQYHEVYDSLLSEYFESGEFEKEIDRVYKMIRSYVEKDGSAFYTAAEFDKAYENLRSFCCLRAQSIRAQIDGNLATVTADQKAEDRVDASGVSVDAMGSQGRWKTKR